MRSRPGHPSPVAFRKYGQSPPRTEDGRLLQGTGCFTDDINIPRQAFGFVLRSPHPHARIVSLDRAAARALPGVLGVFTGEDVAAAELGFLPCISPQRNRDGTLCAVPPYPLLAQGRVRFAGEGVAFVVAESLALARDAAERIEVRYEVLPAVVETARALDADAPPIWDAGNLCLDWALGDESAVDSVFRDAAHVTRLDLVNNRIIVASMEPRGAVAQYDAGLDAFTLHCGTQGAHNLRGHIETVLKVPSNRVRVITRDVGGGFGMKTAPYPEYLLTLFAAKTLGRPVKWISDRSEAFLSDAQARDQVTHAELALDRDGRFLALRIDTIANMGAYLSTFAPEVPTVPAASMHCGVYGIPKVFAHVRCAFTNTTPVEAYRGSGRPEAAYTVERLVDQAARELGIDPAELRRRNFVAPEKFPFRTATGLTYDSADYARCLDDALELSRWHAFDSRRAEANARGRLRGIGMAAYTEICGIGAQEFARLKFDASGAVTLLVGTQSTGQGHETVFAQVAADILRLPMDRIRVVQGDTEAVDYGRGTGGSRSLQIVGPAIRLAGERLIAKARRIAAHALEAAEADLVFDEAPESGLGRFAVAGTDRALGWTEVIARAFASTKLPPEIEPGLSEHAHYKQEAYSFPNGCHVAEVEIDPATGALDVVAYIAVDDFGRIVNPALVMGQVHGALAQGLGQALVERCAYDAASGQLATGSFMDYALPRAADFPAPVTKWNEVPSPANPLGVKGCAEAGCVGGPPAVVNAVIDALAPLGFTAIDMPVTSEVIWRAIHGTRAVEQGGTGD